MEVEVKARLNDIGSIMKKLTSLGAIFENSVEQNDSYFKPLGFDRQAQSPGDWIIRIRTSGSNKILTMKVFTDVVGAWIEHETGIDDEKQVRRMLDTMGMVNVYNFNKKRIPGRLDDFELCIDDVRELGKFLEVSLESEDSEKARDKIIMFMKGIGIEETSIEKRGYGEIMGEMLGHKFKGMR